MRNIFSPSESQNITLRLFERKKFEQRVVN